MVRCPILGWRRPSRQRAVDDVLDIGLAEVQSHSGANCPTCLCDPQPPVPASERESPRARSSHWTTASFTVAGVAAGAYAGHRRRGLHPVQGGRMEPAVGRQVSHLANSPVGHEQKPNDVICSFEQCGGPAITECQVCGRLVCRGHRLACARCPCQFCRICVYDHGHACQWRPSASGAEETASRTDRCVGFGGHCGLTGGGNGARTFSVNASVAEHLDDYAGLRLSEISDPPLWSGLVHARQRRRQRQRRQPQPTIRHGEIQQPATPESCGLEAESGDRRPGRDASEAPQSGPVSTDVGGGRRPPQCTVPGCRTHATRPCLWCSGAFCVHHIRMINEDSICVFCLNNVTASSLKALTVRPYGRVGDW